MFLVHLFGTIWYYPVLTPLPHEYKCWQHSFSLAHCSHFVYNGAIRLMLVAPWLEDGVTSLCIPPINIGPYFFSIIHLTPVMTHPLT